jgi:predicted TIM-barrel fold metal-dependent hydrolase
VSSPVVDVHCHVFNADDLPVRGFVQRLHLHTPVLGPMLAVLIDQVIQGGAPGYAADMARIRTLLAPADADGAIRRDVLGPESLAVAPSLETADSLDADVDAALADLTARDPVFVRRLAAALAAETAPAGAPAAEAITAEGWTDRLTDVRRAVRWAKLFGLSRLDLAAELVRTFGDQVDLFCPLLVDLGSGLGDQPKTTLWQQVSLLEGVSRLTMQGRLPKGGRARLHPFVGFDPRRQVKAVVAGADETPLDVVQPAVLDHGFIGVKVYPPMGWRPLGNTATIDMPDSEARLLDQELRTFYAWCEQAQVPVTAHSNRSNHAHDSFKDFAGPTGWTKVLKEFPDLRLNLGHFGGARAKEPASGWPWKLAGLATSHGQVFADVGNHRIDDDAVANGYLTTLAQMFGQEPTKQMRERLMYGSDWFMLAILPKHEAFLDNYRNLYRNRFGNSTTEQFLGKNALTFLGFDDPDNANTKRLRKRYETHAPDRMPAWLAAPA